MNARFATSIVALTLACGAGLAWGQTTVAPDPAPAKVGVTQGTAMDAQNKAVPRSDTATLVRTNKGNPGATMGAAGDGSAATGNRASTDTAIDDAEPTAAGARVRHARN